MSPDNQVDIDSWLEYLENQGSEEGVAELAQQLQTARPEAPALSAMRRQQLWTRVWQQYQAPFGATMFTTKLIGVVGAVIFAAAIITTVIIQSANPPATTVAGSMPVLTGTVPISSTTTISVTVSPTVSPSAATATPSPASTITAGAPLANCTRSQGYWKNHAAVWPATELTLGGVTYAQEELIEILRTPTRGDATYIMAYQLIAAELNMLQGVDDTETAAFIAEANQWLAENPIGSDPEGEVRETAVVLSEQLEQFNSGAAGIEPCDDIIEPTPTITATMTVTATSIPTVTVTVTPTVTITPTATVTITVTPADGACTGVDPHPRGMDLAERYGVSYDEIMGWFCAGFGFGEIQLAYDLHQETGAAVGDLFNKRKNGQGWGQIRQELGVNNGNGNGNGNNGNNDNGNNGNNGNGNSNNGNNGNNGNGNGNGSGNNGSSGNGNSGNNGNGNSNKP